MSALGFNNSLGIHDNALLVRAQRFEVLANNLANADTPNYKARDIDFKAILNGEVKQSRGLDIARTRSQHIPGRVEQQVEHLYRNPSQPSIDGNTVDANVENSEFTKNAMDYNASFDFLNRKFKGLISALRGD